MRKIWAAGTILSLLALAFWAGYISYPLIQGMAWPAAAAPEMQAIETPTEMAGLPSNPRAQDDPHMRPYWEAWEILERDFYGPKPDPTARTYGAIRGLADAFNDPYTYFLEPQPRQLERDELRGRFGGIGAGVERTDEGFVLHPLPDQPADRAGIRAGDLLVRVDDIEIGPELESDDVVSRVRGPVDSIVTLEVRRSTESLLAQHLSFEVTRAEIHTPSVEWRIIETCPVETGTAPGTEGEFAREQMANDSACAPPDSPSLGYIRHTLFSERSPAEMTVAVEELHAQGTERFILDLRGNPGGLVSSAVAVADLWLDGGPIYIEQRADGSESITEAQSGEIAESFALIVIVDGSSASASEIVAGALQDQGRATLIGEQTFGKGSVQLIHELSDQSSIHVTNAEWYTPARRRISPDGLLPDIIIEPGSDPLAQAIGLLSGASVGETN